MMPSKKTKVIVQHRVRLVPLWDDGTPVLDDDGTETEVPVDTVQTHPVTAFHRDDGTFEHVATTIAARKLNRGHTIVRAFDVREVAEVSRRKV